MGVAPKGGDDGAGMDKIELKKAFTLAKRQPMNVGLGNDNGKIILIMDKLKKGRPLMAEIEKGNPKPKDPRFGVVTLDPDNRKRAIFQMNKPAGGLARNLVKALKGTGISKVLLRFDDGTPEESEQGEDDEEEIGDEDEAQEGGNAAAAGQTRNPEVLNDDQPAQAAAPAADGSAAAPAANAAPAADAPANAPAANGQAAAPADPAAANPQQPDASGLIKELTQLATQMMGVIKSNPAQAAPLTAAAKAAQDAIRSGDVGKAQAQIETLRGLLDGAGAANGAAGAPANGAAPNPAAQNGAAPADASAAAPVIAKARTAWVATRQKVETDLDKLHAAFGKAFQGHQMEDQITKAFRDKVDTVLDALDEELTKKLDAVNAASAPDARAQLVAEAKGLLQKYQQHVQMDPTIKALDENPFIPMAVQKTMTATLAALEKTIR